MTRQHVYFVRYGLTKYPLVENEGPYDSPSHPIDGFEQGLASARRLATMPNPPVVVYSSPLHRAVQTSQQIVHALGKTEDSILIEEGLVEWLTPSLTVEPDGTRLKPRNVQQLVDMTFTEIDQSYRSLNPISTEPSRISPGAPYFFESEEYLLTRAKVSMQRILEHADGKNIAIVSHVPTAQAIAVYLEGAPSIAESKVGPWALGGVTMFSRSRTSSPAPSASSQSTVFTKGDDNEGWKLEMYADTSHMPGDYKHGLKEWSLPLLTKK